MPSTVTYCELENNCNAIQTHWIFRPCICGRIWECHVGVETRSVSMPGWLPGGLVKCKPPVIQPYLLSLFNACIATEMLLLIAREIWRSAKVTILRNEHKPSYDVTSSYHPISIRCALSKVFEKVLHSRLTRLSLKEAWLNDNQHGFHVGRSTESAGVEFRTKV